MIHSADGEPQKWICWMKVVVFNSIPLDPLHVLLFIQVI